MCSGKRGVFMYRLSLKILLLILLFLNCIPFIYCSDIKTPQATQLKCTDYNKKFEVSGIIETEETIPIALAYPVYIKECHISENSYVNKGQLLFTLDIEKMQNTVKNYSFTDSDFMGTGINKEDFFNLPSEIYATESGTVRDIAAHSESLVMAEEALCVIDKSDKPVLKITLNQQDYTNISVGDKVVFSPIIAPAREYSGTVTDKPAVVRNENSLTGSKTVIDIFADVDCADEYISAGLQFTGTVFTPESNKIFTLPYEYINQDDDGEYVNILKNGKTEKLYVETGIETEKEIEIKTQLPAHTVFIEDDYKGKLLIEHID